MKNSARVLLGLVLGAAVFAAVGYSAEEKPKAVSEMTDANVEAAWQKRLGEIDLGDQLPLGEVVRHLGQRFPELNFVVPESARDASVPRLVLRNVTLDEILKAIELASEGRIRGGVPPSGAAINPATGLPIADANARRNLVTFSIGSVPGVLPPARLPENSPVVVCRVFSLAPFLAYRSEKDADAAIQSLYEALEIAWNMLSKQVRNVDRPELKIHAGTKLLIAVGKEQELAVIDQVVKQLQGAVLTGKMRPAENESKSKPTNAAAATATGSKP